MLKKKQKKDKKAVTKFDYMKLKLLFNCLDYETISNIKTMVDEIYLRKQPKEVHNG